MTIVEARLRVRYAETDQMGVVYHSNYLIWFEVGRVEFLRQLGFSYKQLEGDEDCHLPVAEVRCRYKAPARYDDNILICTHLKNVRGPLVHYVYEVFRESDHTLLAEGETMHIVMNGKGERCFLPPKYMAVLKAAVKKQ